MQPTQHAPHDGSAPVSGLAALIEGWKLITIFVTIAVVVALLGAVLLRQRYEASVTLSTVSKQPSLPLGAASGLAAQFLNLNGAGGIQATPALVARLTRLQSVLLAVAAYETPGDSLTIIERLRGRRGEHLPNSSILRRMSRAVTPSWDRESGLVTIRVVHADSALARAVAEQTVAEITRVFRQASRAQAIELRQAQQARLDSAEHQLRHAEQSLVDFLSANRVIAPYSAVQAQLQSRQRTVDIAQSVYLQVRTESEAAVSKELEETPVVVVLDSLPAQLPRVSISLARVAAFALVMGLVLGVGVILFLERSREQLSSDPDAHDRLVRALRSLPIVGRRLEPRVSNRGVRD